MRRDKTVWRYEYREKRKFIARVERYNIRQERFIGRINALLYLVM